MNARRAAIAVGCLASCIAAAGATAADAATLLGGRQQAAVRRAFLSGGANRRRAVVAILGSSTNPAWAAVRWVVPDPGGNASPARRAPYVQSTYYVRSGSSARAASPPAAVRSELSRPFSVAVVYSGSGAESIAYNQTYTSPCAGAGAFTSQQTDAVLPMSWSVRWVVDLGKLLAAVGRGDSATLVPKITFDGAASHVDAVETVQRTLQDSACGGSLQTLTCRRTFRTGGPDAAGALALNPRGDIVVAVPLASSTAGSCDPGGYTLGQSLWDSGAAAATVRTLGLLGGRLPGNPYAPIRVSWPRDASGVATSPCQGQPSGCTDRFAWHGTVQLQTG
ncbi:MAG TPA: hypothetical protein VMU66_10185 [Gaiellales bacterium]|nr:hypothetical protein [Gaiellales bacterium]